MSKQQLHLLAVFGLLVVVDLATCEHAASSGARSMQPRAPGSLIGSERIEDFSNAHPSYGKASEL